MDASSTPIFSNFREEANGRILTCNIQNINLGIVNSLRRVILAEIPNVAVAFDPLTDSNPDINIITNTSPLHNEFLGHRLSLLPVCLSETEIEDFDPSKYKFKIHVKNTGEEIRSVTSKDIEVFDEHGKKYPPAFHARVFPMNPFTKEHVLLVKLRPNIYNSEDGEEVHIEFRASKNIAKAHARWSPVSCCSFQNTIDEEKAQQALQKELEEAAQQKGSELDDDERTKITRKFMTLDKYRYFKVDAYDEPCHWTFRIESECAMRPMYILHKGITVLREKFVTFKTKVQEKKDIVVRMAHTSKKLFEIIIDNEDYTLVNLLQCIVYDHYIRHDYDPVLSYIGYHQPHPLDTKMMLKLAYYTEQNEEDIWKYLFEYTDAVIGSIDYVEKRLE